ncbi:MAG: ATP-binding protein [Rhodoferax sp.]
MHAIKHIVSEKLGIRTKLIFLFILIKVVPLILLAMLAWEGVTRLGSGMTERAVSLGSEVRGTVTEMGNTFSQAAVTALNDRARAELERLTTDTARSVADFLYDRDHDLLLAAQLDPSEALYRTFVGSRQRSLTDSGQWTLALDGKSWQPKTSPTTDPKIATPSNAENKQDFHYRPPETVLRVVPKPLYHEITFVGLDGQEKIKVEQTGLLPRDLRDVSKKENTWNKAETYFSELKKLKAGEIYVSEVIGSYVPSRVIGTVVPEKTKRLGIAFEPEKEAYAGRENPNGKPFQGIIRWATPVVKNGAITGYVTLALDHTHVMSFTDNLMPTPARYTAISDATNGNYAFMWDFLDRNIAHPRHHSIVGFDPRTGDYATPWLEASVYEGWQKSAQPLAQYLKGVTEFEQQSREKKPAKTLTQSGFLGLDCRYLNFAPQCQGWHDLTQYGGSGSFLILWSGVWKLTTAAAIPYRTGQYANTPRGFGYVTIGANVEDFHGPAKAIATKIQAKEADFGVRMKQQQLDLQKLIADSMRTTAASLAGTTFLMVALVVVVAIWLASMLTGRITQLVKGLRKIEGGDLNFRFKVDSQDELGRLNESLNKMAISVQESFQRLEDARHQAEENSRMKSDFVASVSHELRTPLNGILGFAELIRDDATNEETRDQADTIYQSGMHLLSLVNDILDVAKIESGQMTLEDIPFDLPLLLQEIAAHHGVAAHQKGLDMTTHFAPGLPAVVVGDPMRLRQIMNNLLDNAVKFTVQGGIQFSALAQEGRLTIGVRDTGRGIPAQNHAHIFDKFSQTTAFMTRKHGGTGLGLSLVKDMVKLMGGAISLESKPGGGAYFEFWIPLVTPAGPTEAPAL